MRGASADERTSVRAPSHAPGIPLNSELKRRLLTPGTLAAALRNEASVAATYHQSMMVRETMEPGLRYLAIAGVIGGGGQGRVEL